MHVKGVAWQINRHRVLRRDINGHQARAPNALYRHLFWLDRQLVLFGFAEHIVTNFFIRPRGIGPCRHRNVLEIILETVIREDGRSDLEAGHYQSHDRKKSRQCLHTSHSKKLYREAGPFELSGPGLQHPLKIIHYGWDRNIAYLASRALNGFDSIFGNFLAHGDSKRDTDQISILELHPRPFVAVV